MKITIKKKDYPVHFGFGSLKLLCKMWGVKKVSELDKFFKKLEFKDEPEIEQWDLIGDLVLSGVLCANKKANTTSDQIIDALFLDTSQLGPIIELFTESLPKPAANPETRGK